MMPEEDEEMAPGGVSGVDDSGGHQPEHQQKHGGRSTAERSSYYSSTGSRDRGDGRYDDEHYHRSGRDRERDRNHREPREHRDRNRDREHRDRDHGGRYREHYRDHRDRDDYRDRRDRRSRSRSKESRSRDRDRDRHRSQRGDDRVSRDASRSERTVQDRLSAEIEQELANLRRQHDLKEALKKLQKRTGDDKGKASNNEDDSQDEAKAMADVVRPVFVPFRSRHLGKQNSSSFLPKNASTQPVEPVPEIQTEEERIEFQRKMQEKLQQHLAAEGKLYPPPAKPQRDMPAPVTMTGFANDGSFLEMFKQLQQQAAAATGSGSVAAPMQHPAVGTVAAGVKPTMVPAALVTMPLAVQQKPGPFKISSGTASAPAAVSQIVKPSGIEKEPPPPPLPVFGRRRGGKILKTGLVKKVRPIEESTADTPNDAWTLYLQEVKKYKSASCDADSKTRPLVK